MFKNTVPCALMILACTVASTVYAGKIALTTYNPAPSGEYDKFQSNKSCVGTNCADADVANGNLRVKKNTTTSAGGDLTVDNDATITGTTTSADANITGTTTSNNLTVTGTTTVSNTGSFVIQRRGSAPANPAEGQIWIE